MKICHGMLCYAHQACATDLQDALFNELSLLYSEWVARLARLFNLDREETR